LAGFFALQSPIIGHGWIGESVHLKEVLPIGSHSTVYGLLYIGGIPSFFTFVVAMLLTFTALGQRLLSSRANDPRRTRILVGLGLTLCLTMYCPYEALFSLTLPCLLLFTFIGGCLRAKGDVAAGGAQRRGLPQKIEKETLRVRHLPQVMPGATGPLKPARALQPFPALRQ
jgi:hypothetical protein